MYLSRIKLDTRKRATMIALSNPQQFHGAIETALGVDNERSRTLWRLDTLDGEPCLLILTKDIPTLSTVAEQFSCNSDMVETKKYDALLDRIVQGSQWRFRLTANPTKGQRKKDRKTGEKSPERGKVAALISVPQQEEWLLKRAEEYGFSLLPDAEIPALQNKEPAVPVHSAVDYISCHLQAAFLHVTCGNAALL